MNETFEFKSGYSGWYLTLNLICVAVIITICVGNIVNYSQTLDDPTNTNTGFLWTLIIMNSILLICAVGYAAWYTIRWIRERNQTLDTKAKMFLEKTGGDITADVLTKTDYIKELSSLSEGDEKRAFKILKRALEMKKQKALGINEKGELYLEPTNDEFADKLKDKLEPFTEEEIENRKEISDSILKLKKRQETESEKLKVNKNIEKEINNLNDNVKKLIAKNLKAGQNIDEALANAKKSVIDDGASPELAAVAVNNVTLQMTNEYIKGEDFETVINDSRQAREAAIVTINEVQLLLKNFASPRQAETILNVAINAADGNIVAEAAGINAASSVLENGGSIEDAIRATKNRVQKFFENIDERSNIQAIESSGGSLYTRGMSKYDRPQYETKYGVPEPYQIRKFSLKP